MFDSKVYNYINVLDKAADASWIRNDAISNNIANAATPGYKRQDVDFETELQNAMSRSKFTSLDEKIDNIQTNELNPRTYTDYSGYSYRKDGNNVDIDTENVQLAANQIKYSGLIDSITEEFKNLKAAMR